ncbi:MAG: phage holin family protein [Candidatus Beckwithbacteria bacterium]|nr:phage holin family protein [Candidatus Beckwithbacteria bacterium]
MKHFLRQSLLTAFSLFIVAKFYPGLNIPKDLLNLIWAGFIISLLNQLVKPVIKLLLLPINLLTLGLFSWLANVLVLLIATKIIPDLTVTAFTFFSISYAGFITPTLFINPFVSLILASFFLSLVFNFLNKFLIEE